MCGILLLLPLREAFRKALLHKLTTGNCTAECISRRGYPRLRREQASFCITEECSVTTNNLDLDIPTDVGPPYTVDRSRWEREVGQEWYVCVRGWLVGRRVLFGSWSRSLSKTWLR